MGIGPGDERNMTMAARQALQDAEHVFGYSTYIELVRPLLENKSITATGMRKEVDRVREAVHTARQGTTSALICSGDPGIYALAGLVFEICSESEIFFGEGPGQIRVEVIPGVPALGAGAALLGAPLTTDFAAISLSDLLTPWEKIQKRIRAAAEADFVLILYNPKSKKRNWQLEAAKSIILEHRLPDTPVGLVTSAMRQEQSVTLATLAGLDSNLVGMQTTVFVGSSETFAYQGRMVTPRGYKDKYHLGPENGS